jgi:sugar phosphate isomerase/epimerase
VDRRLDEGRVGRHPGGPPRAARNLPVTSIKIASGNEGGEADPAIMAPALHALAVEAAAAGTIVVLEPCAFAALSDLEVAVALVQRADHAAAGILLDLWHLLRAGFPLPRLREVVPPGLLRWVELDDARGVQVGTGLEDTFDRRILCGQGEGDTVRFVRELRSLGWHGPWGVEHMSVRHRSLPVEVALQEAADAARACLRVAATRA